jgi:tetratricopeptide (TPR) repeat protein
MYKTKITQWGLLKNYKASEKEHLVRVAKAHHDSGQAIPRLVLRNRPAKIDRIRRFCKKQKIPEEIYDALPLESSPDSKISSLSEISSGDRRAAAGAITTAPYGPQSSSLSSVLYRRKGSFDPERPFSMTSKNDRVELILLQIKIYYEPRFPSTAASDKSNGAAQLELQNLSENAELSVYLDEWRSKLVLGVLELKREKSAQGWRLINEACGMFHRILDQKSLRLFGLLFYAFNVFNVGDWAMHSDLSAHLLRFFTKIAAARLGCKHPICIVLYHLQGQELFADAVRPAFEVLMDLFNEVPHSTVGEVWNLKEYYCRIMKRQGDYFAAQSICLRALKQSEDVYGRLHWRTRSFLYELGAIDHAQGLHDLAEAKFQDVLQLKREDPGGNFPDEHGVYALQMLASIYENRDFVQSEEYWREALEGAIKVWGRGDECTIYLASVLERSFKRQGKDPGAWLQQNFGISCI